MAVLVRPEYISLNDWVGSLMISFGRYHLPILYNEEDWEKWAEDLLSVPPFRGRCIPSPSNIETQPNKDDEEWQPWARAFYLVVSSSGIV